MRALEKNNERLRLRKKLNSLSYSVSTHVQLCLGRNMKTTRVLEKPEDFDCKQNWNRRLIQSPRMDSFVYVALGRNLKATTECIEKIRKTKIAKKIKFVV